MGGIYIFVQSCLLGGDPGKEPEPPASISDRPDLHYVAKFIGTFTCAFRKFQAFHFSLKTWCPPSMLLFDIWSVWYHIIALTTLILGRVDDPHNVKESWEINVRMQWSANKTLMSQQFFSIVYVLLNCFKLIDLLAYMQIAQLTIPQDFVISKCKFISMTNDLNSRVVWIE